MTHFLTQNISPEAIIAAVFCFGLVVGSFLNVVILRLPQQLKAQWRNDSEVFLGIAQEDTNEVQLTNTLLWPPSHCTNCGQQIKPWQNIPVISYLLLRGRCNNCSHAISLQYPFVELLTGFMLAVTIAYIGDAINAMYAIIFTLCLIALAGIDINEKLLPDQITLPLLWIGLFANINGTFVPLPDAVAGAIAGYLSLWSLYWIFKLVTK